MSQKRLQIIIKGAVQGVGFRPFIYRLATELNLKGWVNNTAKGVTIDIEGEGQILSQFLQQIEIKRPPAAYIQSLETQELSLIHYSSFEIHSSEDGDKTAIVLPDLSTCSTCLQELFDPQNRRYRYPFINCTHCGPRYSIIGALPYDRPFTTMKNFQLCEVCNKEYNDPLDRRFHAQPNACQTCGPHLELWDREGNVLATQETALNLTVEAIKTGQILAIKGLGGFHLMIDASNENTVKLLRQRKHRPDKPFALMYPSLERVKADCLVSPKEEELLLSSQSPIVILRRKNNANLAPSVAPNNPYLGVMLPYTPLHHLLLNDLSISLVATSGNLSDEPICIDEREVLTRLGTIADLFLVHNRPILRPIDDSIVRIINDKIVILRRARGYAPFPITINSEQLPVTSEQLPVNSENLPVVGAGFHPFSIISSIDSINLPSSNKSLSMNNKPLYPSILAVGGQLKNTIAILRQNNIFISQHIGDLGTEKAGESFKEVMNSLSQLYDFKPEMIACDKHPNYYATQYANSQNIPVISVQHHYAHSLACMVENNLNPPVLSIAWDGTGYGEDGTIWGGEFLNITDKDYQRVAYFHPFPLLGGDKAIKEPRRIALGLIYTIYGHLDNLPQQVLSSFTPQELKLFQTLLTRSLNSPLTSSVGRLFDGISALLGLYQQVSFEGQAAMALEFATIEIKINDTYPFVISEKGVIYWQKIIIEILEDIKKGVSVPLISTKFHNTLIDIIVQIAKLSNIQQIVLTGGCFQNAYLTENTLIRLQQEGFIPHIHHKLPSNDGAIAVGQIMAVLRKLYSSRTID